MVGVWEEDTSTRPIHRTLDEKQQIPDSTSKLLLRHLPDILRQQSKIPQR